VIGGVPFACMQGTNLRYRRFLGLIAYRRCREAHVFAIARHAGSAKQTAARPRRAAISQQKARRITGFEQPRPAPCPRFSLPRCGWTK